VNWTRPPAPTIHQPRNTWPCGLKIWCSDRATRFREFAPVESKRRGKLKSAVQCGRGAAYATLVVQIVQRRSDVRRWAGGSRCLSVRRSCPASGRLRDGNVSCNLVGTTSCAVVIDLSRNHQFIGACKRHEGFEFPVHSFGGSNH